MKNQSQQKRLLFFMMIGCLFMALTLSESIPLAHGAEMPPYPSYGKGPREVIVFTDYFCFPCQTMEASLEPAISKLLANGDVKVTFVDFPGHKLTGLYAKYFLYATQGKPGYQNAMQARSVLFALAKRKLAQTEADIEKAFIERGVAWKPFDPRHIFTEWVRIINSYKITDTPTCILKLTETDMQRFVGTRNINDGFFAALQAMEKKDNR